MKLDPYLPQYTKVSSKWIKNINITPETIKFLEENIVKNLQGIGYGNDFLDWTLKAQTTKVEINGITAKLNLLHNKGNNKKSKKTTDKMEDNIFKTCI